MKKIIKILSLVLCLELFLLSACTLHDSREKDMKKYMDSIDCEFEGYALIGEGDFFDEIKIKDYGIIDWYIGIDKYSLKFQGNDVSLYKNVQYYENKWCYSMIMMINDEEIHIDHEYLKSHSEAYNKIIKMWERDGYHEIIPNEIVITMYDDNLFIVIHEIWGNRWIWDWEGNLPVSFFHFDITDYSIKYAGYYEKYEYQGVYIYRR